MISEAAARQLICAIGRWLWEKGFVAAADGNLSIRLSQRLVVTPSGLSKGHLRPEQLLVTDLNGVPLAGSARGELKPSTEVRMHVAAYRERPDIGAVIHAHPPVAVALSVAGYSIASEVLPELLFSLGCVPTLAYTTPSSQANADVVAAPIQSHDALILSHHGTLAVAPDLHTAYLYTERVEHSAAITQQALVLNHLRPLPEGEYERIMAMRRRTTPDRLLCSGGAACPHNTLYRATAARFSQGRLAPAPVASAGAGSSEYDDLVRRAAERLSRGR
jgi:L-fuculose-phosphate aldolase